MQHKLLADKSCASLNQKENQRDVTTDVSILQIPLKEIQDTEQFSLRHKKGINT
jgi:hypothetical protein